MKTTTNHGRDGALVGQGEEARRCPVPIPTMKVPTTAPRVMIRISGTAVPRKTQPTMPFFEVLVGQ
jgi:hypothetical protein